MIALYFINYIINVFKVHLHSKHLNAVITFISIVLASLLVGTRPLDAGYDTKGYVEAYNLLDTNIFQSLLVIKQYFGVSIEPIFWGYAWLVSKLGASDTVFIFVTAFISILLTGIMYRKMDDRYYYLSFIGVLFSGSFINLYGNAIRQGLAIPFFLLAFYHYLNGNNRKVLLYLIITFFIHQYTGMLMVIFFLVRLVPFRIYWILWLGCFLGAFVIASGLLNFIPGLSHYARPGGLLYLVHPTYLEFPVYYLLLKRTDLLEDEKFNKMIQFVAVVFLFQTLFIANIYAYNRIGLLRFIVEPIIYTRLFLKIKPEKASRQIVLAVFFAYGLSIFLSETVQTTLSSTSE